MSTFSISHIYPDDTAGMAAVEALLHAEGIKRDAHLDYTCAMFDGTQAVATGSYYGATLRCLAVASAHQGEGLMNEIVSHLMEQEAQNGVFHLFLYTKPSAATSFAGLGFYEIVRSGTSAVFMENRHDGFASYLKELKSTRQEGSHISAVVMNANPFTLGHQHLVEVAAHASDVVHVFIVQEDASVFPYPVREKLVREGLAHLSNVVIHSSGPYLISKATFPSYFLPDETSVTMGHAEIDAAIFCRMAKVLGIRERFCGQEPTSATTALYNEVMARELPRAGIKFSVIARVNIDGSDTPDSSQPVSASRVRQLIKQGDMEAVRAFVPDSTYAYLTSAEAQPIVDTIRATADVVHH